MKKMLMLMVRKYKVGFQRFNKWVYTSLLTYIINYKPSYKTVILKGKYNAKKWFNMNHAKIIFNINMPVFPNLNK